MENYDVNIKIEKAMFVEDAKNKEEAIQKAVVRVQEILVPGIRSHSKIIAVKSNLEKQKQTCVVCADENDNNSIELIGGVCPNCSLDYNKSKSNTLLKEQVIEVDKIFNDLTNVYNKAELELLAQNILAFLG